MKKYIAPAIKTLRAEEILEAMGPAQGYGGAGGDLLMPLSSAIGMGTPSHINRK